MVALAPIIGVTATLKEDLEPVGQRPLGSFIRADLDPSYYGEEPTTELGVTLPERDAFEMALLGHALERSVPVLGICRGLQVLNVALGGTLYQDLPSQFGTAGLIAHRQQMPKWQWTHEIEVSGGSGTAGILASTGLRVN